ncbi:uncharacterized protein K460DRAFT_312411 [Cucurbitaria berberidis CBS 394.84]|uniref:INSIG domain-containing protein n=1 Tax=Cucurbitaria berberidis CBS 394.84 TaxID=1168544 RepID=A0A9P4L8U6_9PLEO|nr:uncharacterized protein K460DRAFT_312411 [Cucurbitaria berberidis CBS 394.84]KAF1845722.1 hypothetical protein K460DRAFT_312411 [Cucurbitaria berberidis CBS 394.84]
MAEDPSVPSNAAQSPPHIYRPIPRRNFETTTHNDSADSPTHAFAQSTPPSANETSRSSDFLAQLNARLLRTYNSRNDDTEEQEKEKGPPPRNKSFLNMTSSTLFGIYDDVGSGTAGERSRAETPSGSGAETPAHSGMGLHAWETGMGSPDAGLSMKNQARKRSAHGKAEGKGKRHTTKHPRQGVWKYAVMLGKLSALYLFGVTYGLIVSHLHETRQLAALHVEGVDRRSWIYLASWGLFGVALGSLLPYVDLIWDGQKVEKEMERSDSPISEQINDVVRSVCAFVGIAFAIRRLPWQSTLQLTLTLALVNPALWYILDRSKPGLSCSLIVTSVLTSFIFLSNPDVLPSPSLPATTNVTQLPTDSRSSSMGNKQNTATVGQELFAGMVSYETLAIVTWVGSVLFCSCVCFGSIGRRLAVLEESGWKRQ